MLSRQLMWCDLRDAERKNIFIRVRNSGNFDGLTDLLIKDRPDGTLMKIRQVVYDTQTDTICINYDFRWGQEEIERKNMFIKLSELFRSTYDSFIIPVDEFIAGVLN